MSQRKEAERVGGALSAISGIENALIAENTGHSPLPSSVILIGCSVVGGGGLSPLEDLSAGGRRFLHI